MDDQSETTPCQPDAAQPGNGQEAQRSNLADSDENRRLECIDAYEQQSYQGLSPQRKVVRLMAAGLMRGSVATGANMNDALAAMDSRKPETRQRVERDVRLHLQVVRQAERLVQLEMRSDEMKMKRQLLTRNARTLSARVGPLVKMQAAYSLTETHPGASAPEGLECVGQ